MCTDLLLPIHSPPVNELGQNIFYLDGGKPKIYAINNTFYLFYLRFTSENSLSEWIFDFSSCFIGYGHHSIRATKNELSILK